MPQSIPTTGKHWLHEWIDEFEIDGDTLAARLDQRAATRLIDLAAQHTELEYSHVPQTGAVVAGPGLELDAPGTCPNFECRRPVFDEDFGALLHYYDFIVMEGPSARRYHDAAEMILDPNQHNKVGYHIKQDVLNLIYVRDSGLANHIIFANKPRCYCDQHFKAAAGLLGLEHLADREEVTRIAKQMSRAGWVHVEQRAEQVWCGTLTHPLFQGTIGKAIKRKRQPGKFEFAKEIIDAQLMSIVFAAATSHDLGLPLCSIAHPEFFENTAKHGAITIDEVVTRLRLPILADLTAREVVSLREQDPASFELFRAALRDAIISNIEKANEGVSPERIGETVWRENLKPALAELDRRIAASRRALAWRSSTVGSIGLISAAVGALQAIPWAAAILGGAAAAIPLAQITDYFKDRQQAEQSSMHFLWKARRLQSHL